MLPKTNYSAQRAQRKVHIEPRCSMEVCKDTAERPYSKVDDVVQSLTLRQKSNEREPVKISMHNIKKGP